MTEPADAGPSEPERYCPRCAGAIRRYVATLVDMAIFLVISAPLFYPLVSTVDWSRAIERIDRFAQELSAPSWSSHAAGSLGLWIALWWCYFTVGWGLFGATPGKWITGLRVVDHQGRCPIGATRALMRLIAYCISSTTLGIGHMFILFRTDKRALHDILAGTRVVSTRELASTR